MDPSRDAEPLHAGSHGAQRDELWQYLRDGPFVNAAAHEEHLRSLCSSDQFLGFTIIGEDDGMVLGQAALMKYSRQHRTAEIGYVLFLPVLQRTRGGTEALYLLLRHCFETLDLRRLEWRCDSQNGKSERAALRLGFRREGLLRQHLLVKGRSRDTIVFSLVDSEWPERKKAMLNWLADENFEDDGIARSSLSREECHDGPPIIYLQEFHCHEF
jgi:RimJ/RimL family protein N-acetyltransferase